MSLLTTAIRNPAPAEPFSGAPCTKEAPMSIVPKELSRYQLTNSRKHRYGSSFVCETELDGISPSLRSTSSERLPTPKPPSHSDSIASARLNIVILHWTGIGFMHYALVSVRVNRYGCQYHQWHKHESSDITRRPFLVAVSVNKLCAQTY